MVDYSKFDKIDMGSDDEDEVVEEGTPISTVCDEDDEAILAEKINQNVHQMKNMKKTNKTKEGRIAFEYDGRTIYEWEQSLQECNIYLTPPTGLPKELIDIRITYNHLTVGVKDTTPFIGICMCVHASEIIFAVI